MASFKLCPHTCHTDHNRSWRLKSCPIYPADEFDAHLRTHNSQCSCEVRSEDITISHENWIVWGRPLRAWYERQGRIDIVESIAPQYCNSPTDLAFIQRLANSKNLNKRTAVTRSKRRCLVKKVITAQVSGDAFRDVPEATQEEEQVEAVTARGSETKSQSPGSQQHDSQGIEIPQRRMEHPHRSLLAPQQEETDEEASPLFCAGGLGTRDDTVQTHAHSQSWMVDDNTGQGDDRSLQPCHILERHHEMMSSRASFDDSNVAALVEDFNQAAYLWACTAGELTAAGDFTARSISDVAAGAINGGRDFDINEWMTFNPLDTIEPGDDHTDDTTPHRSGSAQSVAPPHTDTATKIKKWQFNDNWLTNQQVMQAPKDQRTINALFVGDKVPEARNYKAAKESFWFNAVMVPSKLAADTVKKFPYLAFQIPPKDAKHLAFRTNPDDVGILCWELVCINRTHRSPHANPLSRSLPLPSA